MKPDTKRKAQKSRYFQQHKSSKARKVQLQPQQIGVLVISDNKKLESKIIGETIDWLTKSIEDDIALTAVKDEEVRGR